MIKSIIRILLPLSLVLLSACSTVPPPPKNSHDICYIFRQYPSWYWSTQQTEKKWRVPIEVQMAIIHQESRFDGDAKPAREKLLGIIPWKRPSTSYGYTQALKTTWQTYQQSENRGGDRDDFDDATDFIGWYAQQAHQRVGIAKTDPYRLYLAYHEGIGGYSRKTYLNKTWLINVARKVKRQSIRYREQLNRCQHTLQSKPWYRLW